MDEGGELFGLERLAPCLAARAEEPAQGICDRVLEAVAAYQGQAPQSDDITLLAIQASR
jgi:serine phosphatase RsbU (regulator of sigma subunit)